MAFFSDFHISNDVCGVLYERVRYENFKTGCITCNEHQSDKKKCYKGFLYTFSLCNRSRKNDFVNGMPENIASRRILTEMEASVFNKI